MSDSSRQTFACPQCGNEFAWYSRIAGTRVSCACGRRFIVPIDPPQNSQTYDLAEEPAPSHPARQANAPRTLEYESAVDHSGFTMRDLLRELRSGHIVLPAILIVLGIAFRFCVPLLNPPRARSPAPAQR
jgi:hypothetical protein